MRNHVSHSRTLGHPAFSAGPKGLGILTAVAMMLTAGFADAQMVPSRPVATARRGIDAGTGAELALLPQAGIAINAASPRLTVEALKLHLGLGDGVTLPFYVITSLPMVSELSEEGVEAALLDEFGGLLNTAVGIENLRVTPFGLFRFSNCPECGMNLEGRAGFKVADIPKPDTLKSDPGIFGEAVASLRLNLPVFHDSGGSSRAGVLSLLVSGVVNHSLNGALSRYAPQSAETIVHLNVGGSLIVTGRFYLSGGYTLTTNDDMINRRWFVSFSGFTK